MKKALRIAYIGLVVAFCLALLVWLGGGLVTRLRVGRAVRHLSGDDPQARREAVLYLVASGDVYAVQRLAVFLATEPRFSQPRAEVIAAMAEDAKSVIPMILSSHLDARLLREASTNPAVDSYVLMNEARELVLRIGPVVSPHLIELLAYPDNTIRADAAELLGHTGDAAAAGDALIDLLGDPAPSMRAAALRGLAWLRSPTTVEPIIRTLESDRSAYVRARAAAALGAIGDARAVEALITALDDEDLQVRISAAGAFQLIPDPRAIDGLIRCLNDPDSRVQASAVSAFTRLSDPRAIEPLMRIFLESESYGRYNAGLALANAGDPRAADTLAAALDDKEPKTRAAIARALATLGDKRGMDVLVEMLGDPDGSVRSRAIEGLSFLNDPRAVAALAGHLTSGKRDTMDTIRALEKIGTPEARKAVDEYLGIDVNGFAGEYAKHIRIGNPLELRFFVAALERCGTLEMAADYCFSGDTALKSVAEWWAFRNDLDDDLLAAKDSPDRPKWGRGGE